MEHDGVFEILQIRMVGFKRISSIVRREVAVTQQETNERSGLQIGPDSCDGEVLFVRRISDNI